MNALARRFLPSRRCAALAGFVLLAASPAAAAWLQDGTPLAPGRTYSVSLYFTPEHDGLGGVLAGAPSFGLDTLYFRVLADGQIATGWPTAGLPSFGPSEFRSNLAADGDGGAYFARTPNSGEVRVLRLLADASLAPAFAPDGVLACLVPGTKFSTTGGDGAGGVFVLWSDDRAGSPAREMYGSRVLPGGVLAPGWPPNGALLASVSEPYFIGIGLPERDGEDGFFALYAMRQFVNSQIQESLRLLHVDGAGNLAAGWPAGGLDSPGVQSFEPDGEGGGYLPWNLTSGLDRGRVLRIGSSGAPAPGWPAPGLSTCPDSSQFCLCAAALPLSDGGAYVAALRQISGPGDSFHLSLVRLLGDGSIAPGWPQGGVVLPFSTVFGADLRLARGPSGACYVVWGEYSGGAGSAPVIELLRVEPNGTLFTQGAWQSGKIIVCDAPGSRTSVEVAELPGGAIVILWSDSRDAPANRKTLYAMRVNPDGGTNVAVSPSAPSGARLDLAPNPARGDVRIACSLPGEGALELAVYDASGRRVRTLDRGFEGVSESARSWDGRDERGGALAPGLYWIRARRGELTLVRRLVRLE